MLFSSLIFLYLFLPVTLLTYYLVKKEYKNYLLLFASLVFFAWGGVSYTIILFFSIILNYFFGLKIQKHIIAGTAYSWIVAGVTVNLLILGVFKYTNFIIENINVLNHWFCIPLIPTTNIILPIGISFYTFHSLSYLIDIYKQKTVAQKNVLDLALYICMFSQLIAGPIIRYSDIWQQLRERNHSLYKFSSGIERFLIGLGKKVLLANTLAKISDHIFAGEIDNLCAINAWLGIICYTLQVYCDFSGYSDMAIGLGRMFGFEFLENFNYPYLSKSIKEFWQKWHISLSSFFRDYLYFTLGGSKVKIGRIYLNIMIVFFLTGFWHGASWNYIIWGLSHGFFIVLERMGLNRILEKTGFFFSILYTLLVLMFTGAIFKTETIGLAIEYWKMMFNFEISQEQKALFMSFMNNEFYLSFVFAILGSFGFFRFISNYMEHFWKKKDIISKCFSYSYDVGSAVFYSMILVLCSLYLIAGTYNPFIYYRF